MKKSLRQLVVQPLRSGWRFNIVPQLGWLSEFSQTPMLVLFGTGLIRQLSSSFGAKLSSLSMT
jgi:hypothetical protein